MRQYILPDSWKGRGELRLAGKEHHYLTRVLRYPRGTRFPGRDRKGNLFDLTLLSADDRSCTLLVEPRNAGVSGTGVPESGETSRSVDIRLYPSLLKGKNTDLVIRQATEAGVTLIQPVISRNSVRKGEEGEEDHRVERWRKIAREAAQQCGNPGIPEILPPVALAEVDLEIFSREPVPGGPCGLFFHEKTLENKPLHVYLREISGPVSLFFGPEGGFSPQEVETFLSRGLKPVYLGDNVLRAETAVLYGTGAVQTILRERDSWTTQE